MSVPEDYISYPLFHLRFLQLKTAILKKSGQPFYSFEDGLPLEWEDYKRKVCEEGRKLLSVDEWTEDDIGSGRIIKRVISAIEINIRNTDIRNNLVQWEARFGKQARSHQSLYDALEDPAITRSYEQLIYDFFKENIPRDQAFQGFVEHAGRKYDYIAYLFYIYRPERYAPIKTTFFDRAFSMMNIPLRTARNCSWNNYQAFLSVLHELKRALDREGFEEVSLIHAHSFCWMLANLIDETPGDLIQIPIPREIGVLDPILKDRKNEGADKNKNPTKQPVDYEQLHRECILTGRCAEDIVYQAEKRRLEMAGHAKLAEQVTIVANNPSIGYDILSYDETGEERHIEVKAISGGISSHSFHLTRNEWTTCKVLDNYYFYLVSGAKTSEPDIHYFRADLLTEEHLTPSEYIAAVPYTLNDRH